MATIDEEIALVREALTSGVLEVETQVNGVRKRVKYPSFKDLRDRLNWLEAEKSRTAGRLPRVGLTTFAKGY